ncbi:NAD(P)/FAD-dependent oxidoreductase [Mycolicibacterium sp.]|uniref:NAD(P)/FAD-dependent oxidoreductase n=1 Tax=Mycolicibacterium sp. TaxID=2320850 RepID=UPI003D13A786
MSMAEHAVIVGTGAAGVAVAESLRTEGFTGKVTLVGDETSLPYDRPPLSKQVLSGAWDMDRVRLRSADHFAKQGIRLRLGKAAQNLDTQQRRVRLTDGETLDYDHLVIATGVLPRLLPFGHDLLGVHVLRSEFDLAAMQDTLARSKKLVVIGAGFLGAEVASVLVENYDVTLVDPLPSPMIRQVGPAVGTLVAELHRARGVNLITGTGVETIAGHQGRVSGVGLGDGRMLSADLVLVAIGAVPATDWLRTSGLILDDGVVCDAYCRAAPDVYAAGDVASWPNFRYHGQRMRLEHRLNATEQGAAVARNIVADTPTPFTPIPYFWSDQFGIRLQAYGVFPPRADIEFADGNPGDDRFVVLYSVDGKLVGALGWNHPKATMKYRKVLAESWTPDAVPVGSGEAL